MLRNLTRNTLSIIITIACLFFFLSLTFYLMQEPIDDPLFNPLHMMVICAPIALASIAAFFYMEYQSRDTPDVLNKHRKDVLECGPAQLLIKMGQRHGYPYLQIITQNKIDKPVHLKLSLIPSQGNLKYEQLTYRSIPITLPPAAIADTYIMVNLPIELEGKRFRWYIGGTAELPEGIGQYLRKRTHNKIRKPHDFTSPRTIEGPLNAIADLIPVVGTIASAEKIARGSHTSFGVRFPKIIGTLDFSDYKKEALTNVLWQLGTPIPRELHPNALNMQKY